MESFCVHAQHCCSFASVLHSHICIAYRQLGKILDLLSDDRDTALIGCIQLQHSRLDQLRAVLQTLALTLVYFGNAPKQLPRKCQNRRRLSCAGRSIEKHMRQLGQHKCNIVLASLHSHW